MTVGFHAWCDQIEGWRYVELHHDGDSAESYTSSKTDEGWTSMWTQWTLDVIDGVVRLEWCSDGRDCDGRLTRHGVSVCPLDKLDAHILPDRPFNAPKWVEEKRWQRDYAAESAGY